MAVINSIKKVLFIVFVFSMACLLFLSFIELYLRIFTTPLITPGSLKTHISRRYEFKPGFHGKTYSADMIINSIGLRDYERSVDQDAYRIAVFGDSVTFGIGVNSEETFTKLLESKLNRQYKGKPKVQTFNCGIPSYNTATEYRYVVDLYNSLKPNILMIEYTAQNDSVLYADSTVSVNKNIVLRYFKDILRNLYIYDFFSAKFYQIIYAFQSHNYSDSSMGVIERTQQQYIDEGQGWEETKQAFKNIKAFTDKNRVTLIFAVFANNLKLTVNPDDDPMRPVIRKITSALADAGVEYIILVDDSFRPYAGKESALWVKGFDDQHFSKLAHELAAGSITEFIINNGFLENVYK